MMTSQKKPNNSSYFDTFILHSVYYILKFINIFHFNHYRIHE